MKTKFPSGSIQISDAAKTACSADVLGKCLHRHLCGDWGDVSVSASRTNARRLQGAEPGDLISVFRLPSGSTVQITTTQQRDLTRVRMWGE